MTENSENSENSNTDAGNGNAKQQEKPAKQEKPTVTIETKPKPSIPGNISIRLSVDLSNKSNKSDKE